MSSVKAEELIEEVRKHPVLYDQSTELYRNAEHKEQIWKRVAKELNVEGQEEECKKKWNGIRDSLRRSRQKTKTKSGQAATSKAKYKYESMLEFLIPFIGDRKTLSNVPDEEGDLSTTNDDSQLPNFPEDMQETQQTLDGGYADESEIQEPLQAPPPTTPASRPSVVKKNALPNRKRKHPNIQLKTQQSASSQLMAYILAEKEAENPSQQSAEKHPVDAFLAGIAPSLKALDPALQISAKGKIFNIVQECELEQLRINNERRTALTYLSSDEASASSTPSHVGGPWMERNLYQNQVPTGSNQPNISEDQERNPLYSLTDIY
ncbi:uncharacterized protein LOC128996348 [Macrosteles quadrilineatus]|uniref:uncharacterized protein LOC128985643 n=1 Tax=Macrosteles quadrilineatus TaxID=74068 RepID=UPI0023E16638|nr:uncharacterized protein LOC128985643 [Macrosteles quadrilineatus]XP_054266555.1 uncharacterized protein LOC128988861 [Macrosteles quadrilineatus]XP_054277593.1 uncharacterized protein LOC128996348 [Macrosteles quadrilineatus]